ncbi:MAG: cytidyltransferase [Rhodospirillaceae bacterium TMED8]|nr:cytidyltransferase [Magnetovibrio sp.]OUT51275.1 MAG: cytidyltransferase [Rhodospirillaceae bacterium TMED8]|tara:strand:- start:10078 stop:11622 length:1545 start_codon:yes stop_codon:yes gene_type:complete
MNRQPDFSARSKLQSIEALASITRQAQTAGKKVVLAHGVFDLLHMGHVRHFEGARREGDLLIVTLTADKFVNKGPGRPIFTQEMRAEMLGAIEYIDFVGINYESNAKTVITTIQPNVYVKGSDYENPDDDITGQIGLEREVTEQHGGKLVLTKEITFSSSSLINNYLDIYDHSLRDYLKGLRETDAAREITTLVESVKDYRVLLVGDAIVDEYQYVAPMGKSAKENIIATRFQDKEMFAGGIFAAANHVASICAEVEIITCIGDDGLEDFIRKNLRKNVKLTPVQKRGSPTTRKCRFVEPNYVRKLFEVYTIDDTPLHGALEDSVVDLVKKRAPSADVVIAADFGHGLITPRTIDTLSERARFLAVNTQTNSANIGYNLVSRYAKADYVCIDAPEAQLATKDPFSNVETLISEALPELISCDQFIVTHGREGCVTFSKGGQPVRIPAFTKTVVDTVGAGDAFLSITSPLAAAGGSMQLIGFIGNAAGAMKVGIVGHRTFIEKVPLMRYISTLLK